MLGNHRMCCGNQVFPGYCCGSCGTAFGNILVAVGEVEIIEGVLDGDPNEVAEGVATELFGDMLGGL